jgi:kynurenine formamidase
VCRVHRILDEEEVKPLASEKFIDVSHIVEDGMITYPGLPGPVIGEHLSRADSRSHYAPGTEFQIGSIKMVANTGTYLDAPFHRFAGRKDLSELPLASLADLDGIVIRIQPNAGRAVDASVFTGQDLEGKAVLIHTGWSAHWGTEKYIQGHPFLTEDAVNHLVAHKVALVGIDSLNIDDTADGRRPAHTTLLDNDIPIVEHLTKLDKLPDQGFRFFAVPVKVKGLGSFPVRAFGIME